MKKLIAILLAAAGSLSVCAYTACGLDVGNAVSDSVVNNSSAVSENNGSGSAEDNGSAVSDKVTQSEWLSVFSPSKFLNVTVDYTFIYDEPDMGVQVSGEEHEIIMTDLVWVSSESETDYITGNYDYDSNIYTGNCYSYSEDISSSSGWYTYSTYYENITESTWSSVSKRIDVNEEGEEEEWYGSSYNGNAYNAVYDNLYGSIEFAVGSNSDDFDDYVFASNGYSDFEYIDGLYVCEENDDGESFTCSVKIKDGYVISLVRIETGDNYYYYQEYSFSDYGTTDVTIPEEFTYAYYSANKT